MGRARRGLTAILALLVVTMGMLGASWVTTTPQAFAGTAPSANGDFTVTKTATPTTVPSGGGRVTYTYSVKNNTKAKLYYVGSDDDKCSPLTSTGGLSTETTSWWEQLSYIPAEGTATWTCDKWVTQDLTNTVWFDFANGYEKSYGPLDILHWFPYASFTGTERGTTTATVTVLRPSNSLDCNLIYWSSFDAYEWSTNYTNKWGSITTAGTGITQLGTAETTSFPYGATSLAINPKNPTEVYFTARGTRGNPATSDDLFRASKGGTPTAVATSSAAALSTNRLGFDASGNLWSLASDGNLYVMAADTTTWTNKGNPLPNNITLKSGDLAFDGLGNMWIIGSDNTTSWLYTITAAQLETSAPDAELVGTMGDGQFNGLAFGSDGQLYASEMYTWQTGTDSYGNPIYATDGSWNFYRVNISNGSTTLVQSRIPASSTNGPVGDLASCALPQPVLQVDKTATVSTTSTGATEITYTITIKNTGNMDAAGVTFQDATPTGTTYLRSTLNGSAIGTNGINYWSTKRQIRSAGTTTWGVVKAGGTATMTMVVRPNDGVTQACNQGTVTATGYAVTLTDNPSSPGDQDQTCVTLPVPKIAVDKYSSTTVLTSNPQPVTYTYDVTNPGNEPLKDVKVVDDKCAPAGGTVGTTPLTPVLSGTYNVGDTNQDNLLQQDETWQFTCTATLTGPLTNTATATGVGNTSNKTVTATDTWTVSMPTPGIQVVKTGDATQLATIPQTVNYTYIVTATGTDALKDVTVTDNKCTSVTPKLQPGTPYNMGDTNEDGILQTTESWTYTCSASLSVETTNIATAKGTGVVSLQPVTDTDQWLVKAPTMTLDKSITSVNGLPYVAGTAVTPNDIITYSMVVKNTGTTDLTHVTLTDPVPAGTTYVSGTAQKTYPTDVPGTKLDTKSTTTFATGGSFDMTRTQTIPAPTLPAGATLIEYSVEMSGTTNSNRVCNIFLQCTTYYGQQGDLSLSTSFGGSTLFTVDQGGFGTAASGDWTKTVTGTFATGAVPGTMTLNWVDSVNASNVTDQTINTTTVTWKYTVPVATTTRGYVTDAAQYVPPPDPQQPGIVNRPGSGGGSQSMEDESHGSTEEVRRRAAWTRDPDGR